MNIDTLPQLKGNLAILKENKLKTLQSSHVVIVGLGGVGSWICEGLARTGVGEITLIDLDEVCMTNINRQLPALISTVGQPKVEILKNRIHDINPNINVHTILDFLTPTNVEELIDHKYDLVIDAIDSLSSKTALISHCYHSKIKVITSGSAGGRQDITKIIISDLGRTINDKLLMRVRKKLKRDHNFPKYKNKKFHIPCIYSTEEFKTNESDEGNACDEYLGSLVYITATMGFYICAESINILTSANHD